MPKKEKVQQMFDNIAPTYDKLNHIMSLSVDKLWRRHALKEIVDGTPQRILDVACGTGDSTISIAKAAAEGTEVIGADISEGMMALVKGKAEKAGVGERISLQVADGEALPFGEGTFDRVTCAFGIRNFEHKERGLEEFLRVLKPGGIFTGCFYVKGSNAHTDKMINAFYVRSGFFTPPFETVESLQKRLSEMYSEAKVRNVQSIAVFQCRK